MDSAFVWGGYEPDLSGNPTDREGRQVCAQGSDSSHKRIRPHLATHGLFSPLGGW